jgi:hypothetical protein
MGSFKVFSSTFLIALFVVLPCLLTTEAQTSKTKRSIWRQFGNTGDFEFFYDVDSITKKTEDGFQIVSGYIKAVPLHEGARKGIIMSRKEVNKSTKGYDNYSYSQFRFQMNFTKKVARFPEIKDFSIEGKILDTIETVHDYTYFPEGSIFDLLYKKLAKEMN